MLVLPSMLPLSSLNPASWGFQAIRVGNLILSSLQSPLYSPVTVPSLLFLKYKIVYLFCLQFLSSILCLIQSHQATWPHPSTETALVEVRNNPIIKAFDRSRRQLFHPSWPSLVGLAMTGERTLWPLFQPRWRWHLETGGVDRAGGLQKHWSANSLAKTLQKIL